MFRLFLFLALVACAAAPAEAAWREASSDHFVIYADDSESDVRRFAEMLERYHAALVRATAQNVLAMLETAEEGTAFAMSIPPDEIAEPEGSDGE